MQLISKGLQLAVNVIYSWVFAYLPVAVGVLTMIGLLVAHTQKAVPESLRSFAGFLSIVVCMVCLGLITCAMQGIVKRTEARLFQEASLEDLVVVLNLFGTVLVFKNERQAFSTNDEWFGCLNRLVRARLQVGEALEIKEKAALAYLLGAFPSVGGSDIPIVATFIERSFEALGQGPLGEQSRKILSKIARRNPKPPALFPIHEQLRVGAAAVLKSNMCSG